MSGAEPSKPVLHAPTHNVGGSDVLTFPAKLTYTELYASFQAVGDGGWEEKDLTAFGIPASAVCEIVMKNTDTNAELNAGVRNTSSALARLFQLQEAEAGGGDFVSVHVKADANKKIDIYAEVAADIYFYLVGYWS